MLHKFAISSAAEQGAQAVLMWFSPRCSQAFSGSAALNQLRGAVRISQVLWLLLPTLNATSVPVTAVVISASTGLSPSLPCKEGEHFSL